MARWFNNISQEERAWLAEGDGVREGGWAGPPMWGQPDASLTGPRLGGQVDTAGRTLVGRRTQVQWGWHQTAPRRQGASPPQPPICPSGQDTLLSLGIPHPPPLLLLQLMVADLLALQVQLGVLQLSRQPLAFFLELLQCPLALFTVCLQVPKLGRGGVWVSSQRSPEVG